MIVLIDSGYAYYYNKKNPVVSEKSLSVFIQGTPMHSKFFLGIDIGSVSIKTALLDDSAALLSETYTRIQGDPAASLIAELGIVFGKHPESRVAAAAITGSGGKQLAGLIGALFVNEILAQARFAGQFHPGARTLIEMGGEDAKLIHLDRDSGGGGVRIEDFSMNTACAAGTGSFLDQQANRLHLTIEEFAAIALRSGNPPRLAGRCSVFAKSDMIHLQQIATPDYDIVAGLCFAMARNFKATVGKGKKFTAPLLFLGGVAANAGMLRAFREVLILSAEDLTVPPHFSTSGAIGAALLVREQSDQRRVVPGPDRSPGQAISCRDVPGRQGGPACRAERHHAESGPGRCARQGRPDRCLARSGRRVGVDERGGHR